MYHAFCTAIGLFIAFISGAIVMTTISEPKQDEPPAVVEMQDLLDKRAKANQAYLSFLNVSTMHCGVYHLAAGAKDGQSPHAEDEVYFVQNGIGKIHIEGTDHDVKPGSVVFVKAGDNHYFHSITKDLDLLVFFSKKKPE